MADDPIAVEQRIRCARCAGSGCRYSYPRQGGIRARPCPACRGVGSHGVATLDARSFSACRDIEDAGEDAGVSVVVDIAEVDGDGE